MCIVATSESGHGGRFEPCEAYRAVDQHVQELADENAALRQERDRLAGIVEKADALLKEAKTVASERVWNACEAYQEARHG